MNLALKFLPHLKKKDYPTAMIVTGSTLAVVPAFAMPSYSASKAALKAFFESLRQQYQGVSKIKFIEILPPAVQSKQPQWLSVLGDFCQSPWQLTLLFQN